MDMLNAETLTNKFPYPAYEGDQITNEEELSSYSVKGDGALQHLLAMISDCVYHYELDDNFHDGDMKMAYLTMKKAWESGGDTKPFMMTICRNRKALAWANIMLIWFMVLPSNDDYWNNLTNNLPENITSDKADKIKEMLTILRNFRNDWKKLHEEKRIANMFVSYGKDGYEFILYGKKN